MDSSIRTTLLIFKKQKFSRNKTSVEVETRTKTMGKVESAFKVQCDDEQVLEIVKLLLKILVFKLYT